MKKSLSLLVSAVTALSLAACSTGPSEEEMKQLAVDACTEAVKNEAKYPRAAELIDPIEGSLRPAEHDQGPEGTTQISVNLGEAAFVNAFNVPTSHNYGCVTYQDDEGTVLDTQVLVKEDDAIFSMVAYSYEDDRLQ